VEWFSSKFPGAASVEELDGVRFVRAGLQWTVHWRAFTRYRKSIRTDFDLVIDEVNTMPFFTPLWARIPAVMLMFQLAREVWWYESPFPLSILGFALEPAYLMLYRKTPVFTISRSTELDLLHLGFQAPITIVPIGVAGGKCMPRSKTDIPTFLYVGRLAPSKRIDHMLHALARYRHLTGIGNLWLVGSGPRRHQESLAKLAERLRIDKSVVFWGRVSSSEKERMMAEAHALLVTSVREGWGLVVTEANSCGTPAIVYDVPGLRDSVRNEITGLIVEPDPLSLANAMLRLTTEKDLASNLAAEGKRWSETFSFDTAAEIFGQELEHIHHKGA
jgi:glycosyltransferase involved in cell wall biosynthesis